MQVSVRVVAGAKKEGVEPLSKNLPAGQAGRLKISVKAKAEAGAANARAVVLLAKHLGVPAKTVRIIKGHKTPSKIIAVG